MILVKFYYHQEEQGSTAYITDEQEEVQNSYFYDAFGVLLEETENIPNRITYTGQQYDSVTQQCYLRARNYNPVIGRFTQEDTYRGDGLNLYDYCHSNPVVYYDPSGYKKKGMDCGGKGDSFGKDGVGNPDYSSIRAYRGIDVESIPIKYRADPRLVAEMEFKGAGKSGANAAGWERNAKAHFSELLGKNPEYWSERNTQLIKKGLVPEVDEQFAEYFPQYSDYLEDRLIHHHIGGGGQAVAVPESLHPGFGGIHNVEKNIGVRGNDPLSIIGQVFTGTIKRK